MKHSLLTVLSGVFCATLLVTGCGGGNAGDSSDSTPAPTPEPTPAPTPTPTDPAPSSYSLLVTIAGSGTVKSDPAGIVDCSVSCSASFASGTRVVLTAAPTAGHIFSGWSGGGCSGVGPCTVTMTAAQTVNASFDGPPDNTLSDFERSLVNLPPNTWYEVPNSKMTDVCVSPALWGNCIYVTDAWGGGAFDPIHRKMLIFGGGHADYLGNEVYSFDLRTGKWERLTDPSPVKDPVTGAIVASAGTDPLPDGNPVSRHTYDQLAYITHVNRFLSQGGATAPNGGGSSVTWLFDVDQHKWTDKLDSNMVKPGGTEAGKLLGQGSYNAASGYDPASGLVFMRSHGALLSYNVNTNTWTSLSGFGSAPLWPRYDVYGPLRGAVDTKRHLFWTVGSNDCLVWDIPNKKLVTNDWATTGGGTYTNYPRTKNYADTDPSKNQVFNSGGGDILNAYGPGFDYDSKADQMVGWIGGGTVIGNDGKPVTGSDGLPITIPSQPYALDLNSKTWTTKNPTGAPATKTKNGVYGRWRYLERYNVFILVNSASSNVYFYKNSAGGP
ncbi:MAG: hypothetical protein HY308_17570 [Gammaproteobacteria bacterium]|nr:hypothetical protein [Gammaproteobacteria bacterium]